MTAVADRHGRSLTVSSKRPSGSFDGSNRLIYIDLYRPAAGVAAAFRARQREVGNPGPLGKLRHGGRMVLGNRCGNIRAPDAVGTV